MAIADYKSANGPYARSMVQQAIAEMKLKEMVAYRAEFSSVAAACVRKNAAQQSVASAFDHQPGR